MKNINDFYAYLEEIRKYKIQPGLLRIKKVLKYLGNPEKKFQYAHIAGTNGKGSTAIFLSEILKTYYEKVGLFTSPEILKYNDRIKINDREISDSELVSYGTKVISAIKQARVYLTEFEFCAAIMLLYFSEKKIDFAVIETGMGGRLDATNVGFPYVSIITSISKDHIEFLGNNIEQILPEKFAILKKAKFKIIGKLSKKIIEISKNFCKKKNINFNALRLYGKNFRINQLSKNLIFVNEKLYVDVSNINKFPEYQTYNFSAALEAAYLILNKNLNKSEINKILEKIEIPFRFQLYKNNIIIDASHNVEGIKHFIKAAEKIKRKNKIAVYSCYKDKDFKTIIKMLLKGSFEKIYLFNLNHCRAADLSIFSGCHKKIIFYDKIQNIKNEIKNKSDKFYFVAGSYSTVREILDN